MYEDTKETELKPCPFCGSGARRHCYDACGVIRYMTYCGGGAHTEGCAGTTTASKQTQELADKFWNKRQLQSE